MQTTTQQMKAIGFTEWSQLMMSAFGNNAIAAILFYQTALFKDVIFKEIWRGPLLFLYGKQGGGKSVMTRCLTNMFLHNAPTLNIGDKDFYKQFVEADKQDQNSIVAIDEYTNDVSTKCIDKLKSLYDHEYERGVYAGNAKKLKGPNNYSFLIQASELPTRDFGLYSRCIVLEIDYADFTDVQKEAIMTLENYSSAYGLTHISALGLILKYKIQQSFKDNFLQIYGDLRFQYTSENIEDRFLSNVAVLMTVMSTLKDYVWYPFSYDEAVDFLLKNMQRQVQVYQEAFEQRIAKHKN